MKAGEIDQKQAEQDFARGWDINKVGPAALARRIVNLHQTAYGPIPSAERLVEEITVQLSLLQLRQVVTTREIREPGERFDGGRVG